MFLLWLLSTIFGECLRGTGLKILSLTQNKTTANYPNRLPRLILIFNHCDCGKEREASRIFILWGSWCIWRASNSLLWQEEPPVALRPHEGRNRLLSDRGKEQPSWPLFSLHTFVRPRHLQLLCTHRDGFWISCSIFNASSKNGSRHLFRGQFLQKQSVLCVCGSLQSWISGEDWRIS